MYFTGFADEAADGIDAQIKATKELGWSNIESRNIDGKNIHDISDEAFDIVYGKLEESGIKINCFGSAIGNWSKNILEPPDSSYAEARRAIPRMKRLGTKLIRIMSFPPLNDREPDDQLEEERFARLREIQQMFADEGMIPVHENCNNYAGMASIFTLKMIENVPGMKLVYDIGNPIYYHDRSKPKPWPRQDSWEFYSNVKEHIEYVHVKDGYWDNDKDDMICTYPGEGKADVVKIITDLLANGYDGGISIEPHMAVVAHDASVTSSEDYRYNNYVEYGQKLMKIVEAARV